MYLARSYQSLASQKVLDRIHGVHMHGHIVCMLYGIYWLTNIHCLFYVQWLYSLYSLTLKFRLYVYTYGIVCYGVCVLVVQGFRPLFIDCKHFYCDEFHVLLTCLLCEC